MSGRVCPWVSWDEWDSVRSRLLGQDAKAAAAALDRIDAWRRRGRLPLGVDITSSLVSSFLRDPLAPRPQLRPQLSTQASASSQGSLQSEYALTLIRFVNGVSDSFQKGKVATSVSKHAEYAGLHPMLVDVRHEATHNHLPSLHTLRLAAAHALSWLESNYWGAQEQKLAEYSSEAISIVAQLLENQAARLKFASRQCDDSSSGSDLEEAVDVHVGVVACGQAPSAAGLRKQQRSLLSDLRRVIPASQPAALAAVLVNSTIFATQQAPAAATANPSSSKRLKKVKTAMNPTKSLAEQSKQLQPNLVSLIKHIESVWPFATRYVVLECTTRLSSAKKFMLKSIEHPEGDQELYESPISVHGSLAWLSAALTACRQAGETSCSHQLMQHALDHLFGGSVLLNRANNQFDRSLVDHTQPQEDTVGRLQTLYSFYSNCATHIFKSDGNANVRSSASTQKPPRGAGGAAAPSGTDSETSAWLEVASALKALERELCENALKEAEGSRCQRLGQLGEFLFSSIAAYQNPPEASKQPDKQHSNKILSELLKLIAHAQETYSTTACSTEGHVATAAAAAAESRTPKELQVQSEAKRHIRSMAAPDTGPQPPDSSYSRRYKPSESSEMPPTDGCQMDPHCLSEGAVQGQGQKMRNNKRKRDRVYVAEGWLGCPIGTLPTCISGVGAPPHLSTLNSPPAAGSVNRGRAPAGDPIHHPAADVWVAHHGNDPHLCHSQPNCAQDVQTVAGAAAAQQHVQFQGYTQNQKYQDFCALQTAAASGSATAHAHACAAASNLRVARHPLTPEELANKEVDAAWDEMMHIQNQQMVGHACRLLETFVDYDRCVDRAGGDSMRKCGIDFDSSDAIKGILQRLNVPVSGPVHVPTTMSKHDESAPLNVQIGSSHEVSGAGDEQREGMVGVAETEAEGDERRGRAVRRKKVNGSGWTAELQAQFVAKGLWVPLMQRCAGEGRQMENVTVG